VLLLIVPCARSSCGCQHARIARGSGRWPSARSTSRALERSSRPGSLGPAEAPADGRQPRLVAPPPGAVDERGQPATRPATEEAVLVSRSWQGGRCRPARSGGRLRRRRDSGRGAQRAGHTPRAAGRRAGLDRCAEDANIARGLAGDDAARSRAQASVQSRLRRMQRTNSCTSSSPRQESAQPVQLAAQSTHSSM
jgi:hypothetical protein